MNMTHRQTQTAPANSRRTILSFELPSLPYSATALAGNGMCQETLELHHGKHHQAYVTALNGFVEKDGRLYMWVGKRSLTKQTGPGKLDQMVAGGQPAGISLMDNLIKECAEEAAIPRALAVKAKPIGAVSYTTRRKEGLRRDVLFNYDLAVPADFEPRNTDGEIESFRLYPIDEVAEIVRDTDRFKFNCAVIVIDFLIRHGVIEPDHPDYLAMLKGLHG